MRRDRMKDIKELHFENANKILTESTEKILLLIIVLYFRNRLVSQVTMALGQL